MRLVARAAVRGRIPARRRAGQEAAGPAIQDRHGGAGLRDPDPHPVAVVAGARTPELESGFTVTLRKYWPAGRPVMLIHWRASFEPYLSPQPTLIPFLTNSDERLPQPAAAVLPRSRRARQRQVDGIGVEEAEADLRVAAAARRPGG